VRSLFEQFGTEEKAVRNAFAGIDVGDPAVNAPAPPDVVGEIEPNDDHAHAQNVSFTSTNANVPGLRKIDVIGGGTGIDELEITVGCGKTFGARLEVVGDYDLSVFQEGNSTALATSTNGSFEDDTIVLPASAGCSGSTTFFVRVKYIWGVPGVYVLHMDRRD
jgi:hypothetical protein